MNKSRSFDRAANYYDQTRLMPEPLEKYAIPKIQELTEPGSRVLEVGCGTGRISIPLLERGVNIVGCDLSIPMLTRFQEKYRSAPVTQADAMHLPFSHDQFDAVLTVHVLHLIPAWRDVLREIKRVLRPGGVYLNMRTSENVGVSASTAFRDFWHGWMKEHGVDVGHPGVREHRDLLQGLSSLGGGLSEVEAVRYTDSVNLRDKLGHFANRLYSETWDIPDAIFDASMNALQTWAENAYGNLDQEIVDEVRCVIHVVRFES